LIHFDKYICIEHVQVVVLSITKYKLLYTKTHKYAINIMYIPAHKWCNKLTKYGHIYTYIACPARLHIYINEHIQCLSITLKNDESLLTLNMCIYV